MTRSLTDVAEYVGVSRTTVSRVLNDRPGISESTRQAVLTALDALGYQRPSELPARRVGLMLPDVQSPIFSRFAESAARALAERGLTPVVCARTADTVTEAEYLQILLEQGAAGILFAGGLYQQAGADHRHYRQLQERQLPTVLVNGAVPRVRFPTVSTDDARAVALAYRHLASLGHERIGAVLWPEDHVSSPRRLDAYRAARDHHGHDGPDLVARAYYSLDDGHRAAAALLVDGATGLICASDTLALGAVRAARFLGLSVPADVSVVGYDDSTAMTYTRPPLTTVRQPIEDLARDAVALLAGVLSGGEATPVETLHQPELVVRASTAAAPTRQGPRPPRISV